LETADSAAWSALLTSALQMVGGFADRMAISSAHPGRVRSGLCKLRFAASGVLLDALMAMSNIDRLFQVVGKE